MKGQGWRARTAGLKRQVYTLYYAYKDPRAPWYAKVFAACVVAYAFSPIDLIPDFIPVLGYLDDLVLVPFGVVLALKMLPKDVLEECQSKAAERIGKRKSWLGGVIIIGIWLAVLYGLYRFLSQLSLPGS